MSALADVGATDVPGRFLSMSQRKLVAKLPAALPPPFVWVHQPEAIRVRAPDEDDSFKYLPHLLVRDEESGRVLAVELMIPPGLAGPNLMMLKMISDAYHASGDEFMLIVDGAYDGPAVGTLRRSGVPTAWLGDADEGAAGAAILDVLTARRRL